jgi:hypothetical protein
MQKVRPVHILSVMMLVVIIGVIMAASGFSRDTFMGLLCVGCAVALVIPNLKNIQAPPPGTSRGSYVVMFVLATALAVGGLYVLVFGIRQ